jgi:hypothetical protein
MLTALKLKLYGIMTVVFITFFILVGWNFEYCGHYWPIVPAPDDRWWWLWRNWWNEDWQGKPKFSEKTCPSATLSTKNPTSLDPGLNPGRRGGKPATNLLSYGAAFALVYLLLFKTLIVCTYLKNLLFEGNEMPFVIFLRTIVHKTKFGTYSLVFITGAELYHWLHHFRCALNCLWRWWPLLGHG